MKKMVLSILILMMIPIAIGKYQYATDPCENRNNYESFIGECPHDHRIEGDWFKVKHYTEQYKEMYCQDGILIENCSYEILPWNHPNVSGGDPGTSISKSAKIPDDVPEFTAITAILAIVGAGAILYQKRRKFK